MIINFRAYLRLRQIIIINSVLLLSGCGYIDALMKQQQTVIEQGQSLQLKTSILPIDKTVPRINTASTKKKSQSHSPIYCSKSGEYPGQLPFVALSFYEASVRDVFAEISLLIDFPIVIDEFVEGAVTIEAENIRLDKALDLISASSNLSYKFFNEYILVGVNSVDTPSWASLSVNCRYWPKYISAEILFNSLGEIERQFVFYPKGADYLSISAPPGYKKKFKKALWYSTILLGRYYWN